MLHGWGFQSRVAAFIAAALVMLLPAIDVAAMPAATKLLLLPAIPSAEPFGLSVGEATASSVVTKWHAVTMAMAADMTVVSDCQNHRDTCTSAAALRLLSIVDAARNRTGLARFGEANRAINLAVRPMSDQAQYGVEDQWSSPLATLTTGAGDCEDYAIAKFLALQLAGVAPADLRIVILRNALTLEDHAVVAARLNDQWHLLDNRHMAMALDAELTGYRPLFVLDASGAKRFQEPLTLVAVNKSPAPLLIADEEMRMASMYYTPASPTNDGPSPAIFQTAFFQGK